MGKIQTNCLGVVLVISAFPLSEVTMCTFLVQLEFPLNGEPWATLLHHLSTFVVDFV